MSDLPQAPGKSVTLAYEAMDIYSKPGTRVRFTGHGGYDHHKEHANKFLTVDQVYTVERTEVGGWHTDIYLEGFPHEGFNSVMFAIISPSAPLPRLSDAPPPFYGAQCPSYPACTGGCGLGCTQEIETARAARSSDESAGVRQATIEECAKIADIATLRCVREQIPGDSVANHVAQNIRALLQTESK